MTLLIASPHRVDASGGAEKLVPSAAADLFNMSGQTDRQTPPRMLSFKKENAAVP